MSYRVSVKALAAFTAKRGDLDLRFTPAPSAEDGQGIHRMIGARRGGDYQTEVPLHYTYADLEISGRADGFDPSIPRLEEIKSHRVPIDRVPDNHRHLAWAQLKLYAAMLCEAQDLPSLELSLTYVHVVTLEESPEIQRLSRVELREYLHQQCEGFLSWAEAQTQHIDKRNQASRTLEFPYPTYRTGQRTLAEQVFRACKTQTHLLAQATTGIGKTLATLFPQIKALGHAGLDRIFFLSAKTPGRQLALDSLSQLAPERTPIRVLELVALEKSCVHPENACHGDSCPLAQGFYDRLSAARWQASQTRWWDQGYLAEVARQHGICPYWFSHEMAQWADVVVGDYNYYFDDSALLFALSQVHGWRVGVLVDEAHNLIGRARDMYSVELSEASLEQALASAPPAIKRALTPVAQDWPHWYAGQTEDHRIYPDLSERLLRTLQKAVSAITGALADAPQRQDGEYMRFFFNAMQFVRLAERFDHDSLFDVTLDTRNPLRIQSTLGIRNLIPAQFLEPRFKYSVSTTLFSATLIPAHYHQNLLGLPAETPFIDVESPFHSDQLNVQVPHRLSTRFRDRQASLARVVEIISHQVATRPGNYIAFFSSYQYLEQVQAALPPLPVTLQPQWSGMNESERGAWLNSFTEDSRNLGLAVLGGAFSEGIDLPGARLIGAFVATLGMPANSDLNEALRARLDARFGQGFDYAYRFPGLQKAIQAAGRVIRDTQDQGTLFLLDERYLEPINAQCLPSWWQIQRSSH